MGCFYFIYLYHLFIYIFNVGGGGSVLVGDHGGDDRDGHGCDGRGGWSWW